MLEHGREDLPLADPSRRNPSLRLRGTVRLTPLALPMDSLITLNDCWIAGLLDCWIF